MMKPLDRIVIVPLGAAVALGSSWARAQVDLNPPLPNVLLLIDTSGSMEKMADGKDPEDPAAAATCTPGTPMPLDKMNRWATLVTALTGKIENWSCFAQDRSSTPFHDEYTFDGAVPYDYQYHLPFHRLLSNGCTPGPGVTAVPPTYYTWYPNGIRFHDWSDVNTACQGNGWLQQEDGLLDVYRDRVRFGMMMFDTLPDTGTGADGGLNPVGSTGMAGQWSYYQGWQGGGIPKQGNLPACSPVTFEVGARNSAAPPWEGRLMGFTQYDSVLTDIQLRNAEVQQAIVAMRPFGATPIAGMMDDAQQWLFNDTANDQSTATAENVNGDPLWQGGCRKTYIVLLSDGEPNLEMRPDCDLAGGSCPYRESHVIAYDLAHNVDPDQLVKTYVVGFGLSAAAGIDCKTLTPTDLTGAGGLCETATGGLRACCTLGRIAYEGDTKNAYYADDLASLSQALSTILADISQGSTSRTFPVFAAATSSAKNNPNAPGVAYQFLSSFETPINKLWSANLQRKRYKCEPIQGVDTPVLQDIDENKGDDFTQNVNSNDPAHPRKFFTVVADDFTVGNVAPPANADTPVTNASRFSIRPNLTNDDGLGLRDGTTVSGTGPVVAAQVANTPDAMAFVPKPAACDGPSLAPTASSPDCAEKVLRWQMGENNPGLPHTRDGNELAAIYHSTPVTVSTPGDYLRDESYNTFALQQALRPLMLYTATTDGQLHGFKVASNDPNDNDLLVDKLENNELFSFLPPYVLPGLLSMYPGTQQFLLDGRAIVQEVVFERTAPQAIAGNNAGGATWKTVLVGGGGRGGGFYYAVDVTDPSSPVFLWQLSTNGSGHPLFGKESGTPAIATLNLKNQSGATSEVAVAILPGGYTQGPVAGSCNRLTSGFSYIDASYNPRSQVRCWQKGAARSLSIVRLDTGELIMNLRGDADDGPALQQNVTYKDGFFDSPITGIPVPHPGQPGQVANRIFVGDADGTMWRIDVSSPDPANWTAKIAWDAYSLTGDTASSSQPIQTQPIVSLDSLGNTVLLFSTGDQELLSANANMVTRAWSITEKITTSSFTTSENWVLSWPDANNGFTEGSRVTGPISLFNSVAYFATFTPPATGQALSCDGGFSTLWGVDYVQAEAGSSPPYPKARYVEDPINNPTVETHFENMDPGTVIFGVSVTQTPTCYSTTTFNDPYFGSHTAVQSATEGKFQLVVQTGRGGTATENAKTNTFTQELPPPRVSTRIDSWAAIVE